MTEETTDLVPVVESTLATPERERILSDFLETGSPPTILAKRHGVAESRIIRWMETENWPRLREDFAKALYTESVNQLRKFIADNRMPVITEQLATARALHGKINEVLEDTRDMDTKSMSYIVERMSRALASISATTSKLVAVSEKPFDGDGGESGGRQPLIMIGVHPRGEITVKEG